MSARVSPLLLRAGYFNSTWKSQWYSDSNYTLLLFEDNIIKQYLENYHYYLKIPSSNFVYKRFQHNFSYIYNLIYFPYFKNYNDLFLFNFKYFRLSIYNVNDFIISYSYPTNSFLKLFILNKKNEKAITQIQNNLINYYYFLKIIAKYQNLSVAIALLYNTYNNTNSALFYLSFSRIKFIFNLVNNKFYLLLLTKLKINKYSHFLKQKMKSSIFLKKINTIELSKTFIQNTKLGKIKRSQYLNLLNTQNAFSNYFANDILYDYEEYNSNFFFSFFKKNMIDLMKIYSNFFFNRKLRRYFYKKKKINFKIKRLYRRKFIKKKLKFHFFLKKYRLYSIFLKNINNILYSNLNLIRTLTKSKVLINNSIFIYNIINNAKLLNKISIFNLNLQFFNITKFFFLFLIKHKLILRNISNCIQIKNKYLVKIKAIYYFFIMKYNFIKVKKIKFFKKKQHFFFNKKVKFSASPILFKIYNGEYSVYLSHRLLQLVDNVKKIHNFYLFCNKYNNIVLNYTKNNNYFNNNYHFLPRFIESNLFFTNQFKSNLNAKKSLLNEKMVNYNKLFNLKTNKQTNLFQLKKQKKYKFNLLKRNFNQPYFKLIKLFKSRIKNKVKLNSYFKNLVLLKKKNKNYFELIQNYNLFILIKKTIFLYKKYNSLLKNLLYRIFNLKAKYLSLFKHNKNYNSYLILKSKYIELYNLNIKLYQLYIRKIRSVYSALIFEFNLLKSNNLFKRSSLLNFRLKKKNRFFKLKLIKGRFFKTISKLFKFRNAHSFLNHKYRFQSFSKVQKSNFSNIINKIVSNSYKQKKLVCLFNKYYNSFFKKLNEKNTQFKDQSFDILSVLLNINVRNRLFSKFGYITSYFLKLTLKNKLNSTSFLFFIKYIQLLNTTSIYNSYLENILHVYTKILKISSSNLFYVLKNKIINFFKYKFIKELNLPNYRQRHFKFNEDQFSLIIKKYNEISNRLITSEFSSFKKLKLNSLKLNLHNLLTSFFKRKTKVSVSLNNLFFTFLFSNKKLNKQRQYFYLKNNGNFTFYNVKNKIKLNFLNLVNSFMNSKFNLIVHLRKQGNLNSFLIKLRNQFYINAKNNEANINFFKYLNFINISVVFENISIYLNYLKNMIFFPSKKLYFSKKLNLININSINYIDFIQFQLINNIKNKIKFYFNSIHYFTKLQFIFYKLIRFTELLKQNRYNNSLKKINLKGNSFFFELHTNKINFSNSFKAAILHLFKKSHRLFIFTKNNGSIMLNDIRHSINNYKLKMFFTKLYFFFLFQFKIRKIRTKKENLLASYVNILINSILKSSFKFFNFNLNSSKAFRWKKIIASDQLTYENADSFWLRKMNFLFFFSIYKHSIFFFLNCLNSLKYKYISFILYMLNNMKLNFKLKFNYIFRNFIKVDSNLKSISQNNSLLSSYFFYNLISFYKLKLILLSVSSITNYVNSFLSFNNSKFNIFAFNHLFCKYKFSSNKLDIIKNIINSNNLKKRKKFKLNLILNSKKKDSYNSSINYKSICSLYLKKLNKLKFKLIRANKSFVLGINNKYSQIYNKFFNNLKHTINAKKQKLNSIINNKNNLELNFKFKTKKQNLNSLLLLKLKKLKQNEFNYYVRNFLASSFFCFNKYGLVETINVKPYLYNSDSLNKASFDYILKLLQFRLKIIHFYLNSKKNIYKTNYNNLPFNKLNSKNFSFKTKLNKQKLKFKKKHFIDLGSILNSSKKMRLSKDINFNNINQLIKLMSNTNQEFNNFNSIQCRNKMTIISFLARYFNLFISKKSISYEASTLFNYYLFKFIYNNKNKFFKFDLNNLLYSLSKSNNYKYLIKENINQSRANKLINFKFNSFFKNKKIINLFSFFFFKSFKKPSHSILKYRFNSSNNLNSFINSFKNDIQVVSYNYNTKNINFKINYRLTSSFYRTLKQRRFLKFNKINSFNFNYNNNIYKINSKSPFFSYVLKQDISTFIYNQLKNQFINFSNLKGTNLSSLFFKLNNLIKLYKQQEDIFSFLNKLILILKPRRRVIALIKLVSFYKGKAKNRLFFLKGQLYYYLSKIVFLNSSFNKLNIKFKKHKKKLTRYNLFFYKKKKYISYVKFNLKKKLAKKKNIFYIKRKNPFFNQSNVSFSQFKNTFLNKIEVLRGNLIGSGNLKKKRKKISFFNQFSKLPKQRKYFFLYKNKKKLARFKLNRYKYSNISLFKLLYNKYKNIFNLHYKYLKYNKFNLKRLNSYYRSFLILKLKNNNFNRYIRLVYIKFRYLRYFNLWKNYITKKRYFKLVNSLIRKFKSQFNVYLSFITNKMKIKKINHSKYMFGKKKKTHSNKLNFFLDKLLKTKQKTINLRATSKKKNTIFKNIKSFYYLKFKKLAKLKLKNNYFNLRSLLKYKLDYNNYLNYMKLKANSFFLDYTNWFSLINLLNKKNKYNISNSSSIFSQRKLVDFNSLINYIRFFIKSFMIFIIKNNKLHLNQKIKLIQFFKIIYYRYIKIYKLKIMKFNFSNQLIAHSYKFNELVNLIHKCNKMKNHFLNLISSHKMFALNGLKKALPQFNAICNYSLFYLYLNNKMIVLNNSDNFKQISYFYNKKNLFSKIKYKSITKKHAKFVHPLFNSVNSKSIYFKNKYKYLKLNNKYNKHYIFYLMNNLNSIYLKKKEIISSYLSFSNLSSYLLKLKNVLKTSGNSFQLNSYYAFLKHKITSKFKFNYYFNHFMYQSKVYYSKIKTKYKFQLIYNKVFFQLFKLVNQVSKLTSLFFNINKIEILKNKKNKLISFYLYLINSKSKVTYSNVNKFFILINKLISNNSKKKKTNLFYNKKVNKLLNYQNQFISIYYNNNHFSFNFKLIQFIFFFIKLQTNCNSIINNLFDKLYLVSQFSSAEKQFVIYYYYYYYFYIYYYLIFNLNTIQNNLNYIILIKYKNNNNNRSADLLNKNKYYLFLKLISQMFTMLSRSYDVRSYKILPFLESHINNPNINFRNAIGMLENKKLSFIQLNYSVEHDLNKFSIGENNNIFYFNNIYFYNYDYNFIFTLESKLLCEYIIYAFLSKKQYFEVNDEIKEAMNDLYRFKIIIKRSYDYLLFKLLNYYIDFIIDFFYFNLENMESKTALEYNSFVLLFNNKLKIIIQLLKSLFIIISIMNNFNIKGVRIKYTGRQSRKVRADTKLFSRNKMALNCLVNRIDFYYKPVYIKYGAVGIKVFIYKENEYVTPLYHLLFKGIITRVNTITKLINNYKS